MSCDIVDGAPHDAASCYLLGSEELINPSTHGYRAPRFGQDAVLLWLGHKRPFLARPELCRRRARLGRPGGGNRPRARPRRSASTGMWGALSSAAPRWGVPVQRSSIGRDPPRPGPAHLGRSGRSRRTTHRPAAVSRRPPRIAGLFRRRTLRTHRPRHPPAAAPPAAVAQRHRQRRTRDHHRLSDGCRAPRVRTAGAAHRRHVVASADHRPGDVRGAPARLRPLRPPGAARRRARQLAARRCRTRPGTPGPPRRQRRVPRPVGRLLPRGHARSGRHRPHALRPVPGLQRRRRNYLGRGRGPGRLRRRRLLRSVEKSLGRGSALAVLGVALIVLFLWRVRRRRTERATTSR